MIRIAIIQFPGSNCERETAMAVRRAGMLPEDFFWNDSPCKLEEFAGFIIVGGFSYEDRSRAGIIAAMDPVLQAIRAEADLGKPVLGICNGAQILVESGLVPGLENCQTAIALTDNRRIQNNLVVGTGFYNAWVHMRPSESLTAFTRNMTSRDILRIPVAHAEGRFVIPPALLESMRQNGMLVFQYCDAKGEIHSEFPVNPNGSVDNIAAVANRAGNVMAIMPHPERTPAGDGIFQSMRDYIASGHVQNVRPLRYLPQPPAIRAYQLPDNQHEYIIGLQVTDNHAVSVENTFRQHNLPVSIRRYVHLQIACDTPAVIEKMQTSGFLFNPRKEFLTDPAHLRQPKAVRLLVQPKEDLAGKKLLQQFQQHFSIAGLHDIRHGILWQIEADAANSDSIVYSPVFHNPISHDAWSY